MLGSSVGVSLLTGTWSAVAFCPVGASGDCCLDPEGGGARALAAALATGDGADALLDSICGARPFAPAARRGAARLTLLFALEKNELLDGAGARRRALRTLRPREGSSRRNGAAWEERIADPRERIGDPRERIGGAAEDDSREHKAIEGAPMY